MSHFIYLLQSVFKYGSRYRIILMLIGFVLSSLFVLAGPFLLSKGIEALEFNHDVRTFTFFVLAMCGTHLAHVATRHVSRLIREREKFKIHRNFLTAAYSQMRALGYQWNKKNHSGKSIHIINGAFGGMNSFMDKTNGYIDMLLSVIVAITYFTVVDFGLGIAYTAWLATCLVFVVLVNKRLVILWGNLHKMNQKLSSVTLDYISNMRTILSLQLGARTEQNLSDVKDATYPTFDKSITVNQNKWSFLVTTVIIFGYMMLVYYAWTSIPAGTFSIGVLVALRLYISKAADGFFAFIDDYDAAVEDAIAIKQADVIFKEPVKNKVAGKSNKSLNSIDIDNVVFQYDDAKHPVLTIDNQISVRRGDRVAFVGASGSGKSTFMLLLSGALHTDSVKCNIPLPAIGANSVYIPQDPEFFENTIEYNISVGTKYSKKEMEDALRISRFDIVLKRLPHGLETNLYEKGVNLSGGEKQRLALARGIMAAKDANVILFDECTSSVDSENDAIIMKSLFKHFSDRIIIFSTHKINILDKFDDVYIFNNGIVEKKI